MSQQCKTWLFRVQCTLEHSHKGSHDWPERLVRLSELDETLYQLREAMDSMPDNGSDVERFRHLSLTWMGQAHDQLERWYWRRNAGYEVRNRVDSAW